MYRDFFMSNLLRLLYEKILLLAAVIFRGTTTRVIDNLDTIGSLKLTSFFVNLQFSFAFLFYKVMPQMNNH